MATTPQGHVAAVACHNCYDQSGNTLSGALRRIRAAQLAGADLIELDVVTHGGSVVVRHESGGAGPLLSQILANCALRLGDQSLFVELKEGLSPDSLNPLLSAVLQPAQSPGCPDTYASPFARRGRPLVIRAFYEERVLLADIAKQLEQPVFRHHRDHVLLSQLYHWNEPGHSSGFEFQPAIATAASEGLHMVEFDHRTKDLAGLVTRAHDLGLGVNLFTFQTSFNEVFVAAWREEVDALTIDGPSGGASSAAAKRAAIDEARRAVEGDNELFHFNAWNQGGASVDYRIYGSSRGALPVMGTQSPKLAHSPIGEDLFGGYLHYQGSQCTVLSDFDNGPESGFLVAAVVNFDDLSLAPDETQAIVNKSDDGGFALELHRSGNSTAVARFGVHVNGDYRYASAPVSAINHTDAYMLIGAYDGSGGVRLWINDSGYHSVTVAGGVTKNDSPVVIGADPQGCCQTRFHFKGKIQSVSVLDWSDY